MLQDTKTLDISTIPADVWLCIFEHLTPSSLSSLAQTCSAFHHLTHRCLLRDIRWTNVQAALRNVEDWRGDWKQWCGIPRSLTIKLPFEDKTTKSGSTWVATPSRPLINASLYNTIHHQVLSFIRLHSLILKNTLITPVLYPILASLSLHTLSITHCTYSHTGIWSDSSLPMLPPDNADSSDPYEYIDDFDFSNLSIKELALGTFRDLSTGPLAPLHPFNIISSSSLTSLTLTCGVSFLLCLRDLTSPSPPPSANPFALFKTTGLPSIQSISLTVIKLTHDGELAISAFLALCTNPELKVSLRVHDTEIRDRADTTTTTTTTVGIRNVWKYQGPVAVLRLLSSSSPHTNQISHLTLTDSLNTKSLISGLERLSSSHINVLSVKMHVWDVEVLYAIRGLFRECVEEVRVEFGVGGVDERVGSFPRVLVAACSEGGPVFPVPSRGSLHPVRKGVSSMSKNVSLLQCGDDAGLSRWKEVSLNLCRKDTPPVKERDDRIPEIILWFGVWGFRLVFPISAAVNFAITLGANILPDLKNLRVLKIVQESSCVALTREGRVNRYIQYNTHHHQDYDSDDDDGNGPVAAHPTAAHTNVNAGAVGMGVTWNNIHHANITHIPAWPNNHVSSSGPSSNDTAAAAKTSATPTLTLFDDTDFEGYLLGWNRYCRKLRYVQFKRGSAWMRRFEGDAWVERAVGREDSEGDD
ncbi:uncharacterized protein LACBIDRAFT_333177 [Laccaria bicolor S238N-H82]|uniref:Predicted protein n=1 Tax=Laccaria bicolor (strain S238N-H82 / ATCC MYA-4686) TaxID=486041 RepID=B0DV52_LACBS|nr:uncharacterized protein LACBIDRAFT_333177 [Laccaria bicolor S238N-H82]EDR01450.1 predicted protein [Laccaria bicolor S238N-H82]|eukprot:XP_001887802.1 predicted protein [Laccaria bicolor S238N-H82]